MGCGVGYVSDVVRILGLCNRGRAARYSKINLDIVFQYSRQ